MTVDGIAFDCCFLIDLEEAGYQGRFEVLSLVDRMFKHDVNLLTDVNGHILSEYDRNLPHRCTAKAIIKELTQRRRIMSYPGVPKGACAKALAADGFDPADIPYIGAAQNGRGVFITSEEKHLTPSRRALVKRRCGVAILTLADVPSLLA